MIYPENFEEKTGFTTIRSLVAKYILCDLGKKHLDQISFTTNAAELVQKLSQVNELAALLREGAGFPQQDYFDPTAELIRIKTPGTAIEPETLADLKISIQTIYGIQEFLRKKEADKVKHLLAVVEPAYIDPSIPKEINRIIDENGHIRDNASSALKEIRSKLARKKNETEQKMAAIFTRVKKEGFTVENLEVSIRNGRQVIPVPAAFKRQIKGFVHDESATGQTVYIEPAEIFEINNEIRELENAERREIFRILMFFADFLRPHLPMLLQSYQVLGQIDFIRAKARLALEINGIMPFVKDEAVIEWQNAIHPLLFLVHQKQKKTVVPLNLSLNADQRILLISGPNAGGKSVALKTTGLLQYMLQCGLLIPVSENSTAGIFHHLFIDIGDQQSLEKDLSTYTSHLKNLRHFSKHANERSLLLIDEFGTGTEPQLGGAIAEAVMEHLAEKKSFGIITTHYANLKEAAHRIPGIINGAMLFDPDNLSPLFVLKTGKPGSSYAFEIAEKIGFPKELLKRARKKINRSAFDYDKMLQELEVEKIALHEKQQSVNVADEFLKELIEKYNLLNKDLHSQKKEIITQAKEEAALIVQQSNKLVENTIRQIKESQADRQKVQILRKELKEHQQQLAASIKTQEEPQVETSTEIPTEEPYLLPGKWVSIKNQHITGKIIEVRENEVVLEAGQMIIHVQSDKLMAAKAPKKDAETGIPKSMRRHSALQNIFDRSANFKISIDLRGKKAEEALSTVSRHVDDAILLSIPQITIIHGKGDGVLRNVVHNFLKGIKEVKSMSEGHPDRGGAGMTIVEFSR